MTVIAVYSAKGGVGKTTLAANLAWCAARISRRRTLLWDLDPSGGAAFLLGLDPPAGKSAGRAFAEDADPTKLIQPSGYPNLSILPADESIRELDQRLEKIGKRKRLAKLTRDLGKSYDRIVLDCPPVMNETSAQIMRAADLVVVPLPPSPLSARALELVTQEVQDAGKQPPPMLPVLAMVDRRRALHRDAIGDHPDWPVVPFASAMEQCAVRREPVGVFEPAGAAAKSLSRLWTTIERKLSTRAAG